MPDREDVAVVLGTRPEAIKLAPIIRLLGQQVSICFTGQHYDDSLAAFVFDDLGLDRPVDPIGVGGLPRGAQIGRATEALSERFRLAPPRCVVVQGDTNAALAGALAANSVEVPLVHVEAGLRSFDRAMPEEHNRVLIDHLADVCAAPTSTNAHNLRNEGIAESRIAVTGNPIVESVLTMLPDEHERQSLLATYDLPPEFVLSTFHRPENVDSAGALTELFTALRECPLPVVLPLHPRTRARIEAEGLGHLLAGLHVLDPIPPRTFLAMGRAARFWATDSGGLQEEGTILKRHVVVVRRSTERPEALGVFSRLVPRAELAGALVEAAAHADVLDELPSPFGDGNSSQRIVELLP